MMDVNQTYYNYFTIYISQVMLHTLNLYSAACQLYHNKTGRKNNKNVEQN